jgi:hypothetical protein
MKLSNIRENIEDALLSNSEVKSMLTVTGKQFWNKDGGETTGRPPKPGGSGGPYGGGGSYSAMLERCPRHKKYFGGLL